MKGAGINDKKLYKFTLLENNIENLNEQIFLSHEYQYSLFGFKKTNKSKSYDSTKPSINDFLKLFHVNTQCYIKIITDDNKKKTILDFDDISLKEIESDFKMLKARSEIISSIYY
jgi:hypothetical protein